MKRILLLLDQKENQQLLASELANEHRVIAGDGDDALDLEFDLCIVDGPALDRLWEQVRARKAREGAVLLPILLVTSRPGAKMITRQLWRSLDELIISPIEKQELRARVEILLRSRSISLALQRRAGDAEEAARTRDEVLAMVAHDLRNPLNLVLTSGSFLLETAQGLEPQDRKQLRMVLRAAEQMNRLIRDLLEVSGFEAGHVSFEPRSEPVRPLIEEGCALLEHAARAKGIHLHCEFEPDLPPVHADRDRVLQVLGNLIGNALKFTPEGGRVRVSAAREDEAVAFVISDTGSGISEAELPHVFDRFWQARRSPEGGAGLGLAIARGIVAAHGGAIHAESGPEGAKFVFTLPVAPAQAVAQRPHARS